MLSIQCALNRQCGFYYKNFLPTQFFFIYLCHNEYIYIVLFALFFWVCMWKMHFVRWFCFLSPPTQYPVPLVVECDDNGWQWRRNERSQWWTVAWHRNNDDDTIHRDWDLCIHRASWHNMSASAVPTAGHQANEKKNSLKSHLYCNTVILWSIVVERHSY